MKKITIYCVVILLIIISQAANSSENGCDAQYWSYTTQNDNIVYWHPEKGYCDDWGALIFFENDTPYYFSSTMADYICDMYSTQQFDVCRNFKGDVDCESTPIGALIPVTFLPDSLWISGSTLSVL